MQGDASVQRRRTARALWSSVETCRWSAPCAGDELIWTVLNTTLKIPHKWLGCEFDAKIDLVFTGLPAGVGEPETVGFFFGGLVENLIENMSWEQKS